MDEDIVIEPPKEDSGKSSFLSSRSVKIDQLPSPSVEDEMSSEQSNEEDQN